MLGCVSDLGDFVLFSNKLKLELGVSINRQLQKIFENTLFWKVYLNFWQVTVSLDYQQFGEICKQPLRT